VNTSKRHVCIKYTLSNLIEMYIIFTSYYSVCLIVTNSESFCRLHCWRLSIVNLSSAAGITPNMQYTRKSVDFLMSLDSLWTDRV